MISGLTLYVLTIDGVDAPEVVTLIESDLAQLRDEGGFVFDARVEEVVVTGKPERRKCQWG